MPTVANDLVAFLMSLFGDSKATEEFLADPEKALEDAGLGGVCSADVDAAMPVILDFAPISVNASSFDREYNTGGNNAGTGTGGAHTPPAAGGGHTAPPAGGHDHDHDHDDHAHAVQQLHHVVNNYSYTTTTDDRDTITDQSVNQNIWADGDVTQYFDNDSVVASGDRAVAAGDDVDIEDSNNIEDSYNTDNSEDNSEDNSITAGGDVAVGNTEIDVEDSFNEETDIDVDLEDSFNDNSDNSEDNSTETNVDVDLEDSFNDNSVELTDNSDNSVDVDLEDVGNTDSSTNTNVEGNTVVADNEVTNVEGNTVVADNTVTTVEDNIVVADNTVDYTNTEVEVGDVEAEFTNIDESLIIADNEVDLDADITVEAPIAPVG